MRVTELTSDDNVAQQVTVDLLRRPTVARKVVGDDIRTTTWWREAAKFTGAAKEGVHAH
ncbi:DUF6192 family protein [Streptomyces sp. 35G-GA-8]|nr:DUF6192 family protein [Streptomyces sp. 35G-GA-8]